MALAHLNGDSSGSGFGGTGGVDVIASYTPPATTTLLVVAVTQDQSGASITSVTFGGVGLTLAKSQAPSGTSGVVEIWYKFNPSPAVGAIRVACSTFATMSAVASSYKNADTAGALVTAGSAAATNSPSVAITPGSLGGGIITAGFHAAGSAVISFGSGQNFLGFNGLLAASYELNTDTAANTQQITYSSTNNTGLAAVFFPGLGPIASVGQYVTGRGGWKAGW